jgi:sulfite reductase alpha subunit-like flavoprotein
MVRPSCAGKPITLRAALARYTDLLSPVSKPALQALSAFAEGEQQARLLHLLSPGGVAEYKAWHQQSRSLLEVLEEFSSCRPPLGELLTCVCVCVQIWRCAIFHQARKPQVPLFSCGTSFLLHS